MAVRLDALKQYEKPLAEKVHSEILYNPMRYIADLHIHSHYSRATSKEMNIVSLTKWSQIKGTNVVGTGDFTHPAWFAELQDKLEPAEPGLYRLKPELAAQVDENFEKYGKYHKLNVALLIGGVSFADQERKLERASDRGSGALRLRRAPHCGRDRRDP